MKSIIKLKKFVSFVLVLATFLVLSSCNSTTDPVASSESLSPETRTLKVGMSGSSFIDTFDPASTTDDVGLYLLYDRLFQVDYSTGNCVGMLAKSWSYDDDSTLHIKIREDATFSNGEPVTSEDVIFTLRRTAESGEKNASNFNSIDFDKCKIISDYELTLVTYEPNAALISYLAGGSGGILCKSYVETASEDDAFWSNPVSSGAFTCTEHISGSHNIYQVREDYYGVKPDYNTLIVYVYSESSTMIIDYETGTLDAIFQLDSADTERIMETPIANSTIDLAPAYKIQTICLSEVCPIFDDIRIRQAVAYAIDTESITKIAWGPMAKVATAYLPEGLAYRVETGANVYDPEKAKALLAEAGYPDGFEITVVTTLASGVVRTAEALQSQLNAVGITLNVQSYDLATCIPMWINGESDISLNSIQAQSLDPDQIWDTTKGTSGNQVVRLTDSELNGYFQEGVSNVNDRSAAYANVQNWLAANLRSIPVCDQYCSYCYRNNINVGIDVGSAEKPQLRYITFN